MWQLKGGLKGVERNMYFETSCSAAVLLWQCYDSELVACPSTPSKPQLLPRAAQVT